MKARESFVLGIVGGASGVGKTTLLSAVERFKRVNTGDLFKARMTIASRDDIRNSDWSQFEDQVASDLIRIVTEELRPGGGVIIDTHFAAKLNGTEYRIGLARRCLYRLASETLQAAKDVGVAVQTRIVLVNGSPFDLLARRRSDDSRKRELVPADCIRALSRNSACSSQYLFEVARAYKLHAMAHRDLVELHAITNEDLDAAILQMKSVFEGVGV